MQYRYLFRKIRGAPPSITLQDGETMSFGGGHPCTPISLPSRQLCNLKLAIAKVLHASGAAEVVDKICKDADDENDAVASGPVYLGGPYVSDGAFLRRLNERLDTLS